MLVNGSKSYTPLPSLFDLHHRGELLLQLPPEMPGKVMEQIRRHLSVVTNVPSYAGASIETDILLLLNAPAIRAYVLADWDQSGPTRWAAVAAAYLKQVKTQSPELLGRYVNQLIPCVAATISSVMRLFRLGSGSELCLAIKKRNNHQLRLSMLGPLAMFFLESVAHGRFAWHTLVDPHNAPAASKPLGWAPTLDPLPLVMRLTLLGFTSRIPKRKALLYSPLARYLLELGILQRLSVIPQHPAPAGDNRWLLSHEYANRVGVTGSGAVMLDAEPRALKPWETIESAVDRRTGRRMPSPDELIELAEARQRLLAAAQSLVRRYAGARRPKIKRLMLWAYVADIDPVHLVKSPASLSDDELSALAAAAVHKQWRVKLEKLNARVRAMPAVACCLESTPFTSSQSRITLMRLREDFRAELSTN